MHLRWCEPLECRTRLDPVNGGATTDAYTWEQTASDVTLTFLVCVYVCVLAVDKRIGHCAPLVV
jgi:hypothetical protein